MGIFKKGFRTPSKKDLEKQKIVQDFLTDYDALCRKHKHQLVPILKHLPNGGLEPDLKLVPYEPKEPQLKGWGEAEEDNLKVREKCRHLNENGENCKHCGVRIADQDLSGTGVTEEYKKVKLEKIQAWKEREKSHNNEAAH